MDTSKVLIIILALVVFCSIIIALLGILILTSAVMHSSHSSNDRPNAFYDDIEAMKADIEQLDSISIFKERFPNYREKFTMDYDVGYTIQARNANTGNVLALYIHYPLTLQNDFEDIPIDQSLSCMPGKSIVSSKDAMQRLWAPHGDNLFLYEAIRDTECLDDDWAPIIIDK